jgi:acyl-CoA thioesterase-1
MTRSLAPLFTVFPMPRAVSTLLLFIVLSLPAAAPRAAEKSILVMGDSLSAAYGIPRTRGWVALLEERLKREHPDYIVVNASISGETTGGGVARIRPLLERHKPAIMILELGANDGLRGLPVAQMKTNLAAMIREAQVAGARVLLVGVRLPPNYGEDYTKSFDVTIRELAKTHRTALVPFLLEDFAGKREFFLPDRIHPTEAAQPLMLERVWRALRPLLK